MTRIQWMLCSLFFLFLVSGLQAQEGSVKCESNDGGRKYCGQYQGRSVRMDRQISGSACIEGRTWGVDNRGLWVDRGCRAYFIVSDNRYGRGDRDRDRDWDRDRNRDGDRDRGGWWDRDDNAGWPPRGNAHGGRWERGGACFYSDRDFRGNYFCLRRGESRDSLGSMGDDISSIRTFGGARVIVFDDRDFRGANQQFRGDVGDLRNRGVRQKSGHTWNNRISSVHVQ